MLQRDGFAEPARLAGGFEEVEETRDEERVVVEVGVAVRRAVDQRSAAGGRRVDGRGWRLARRARDVGSAGSRSTRAAAREGAETARPFHAATTFGRRAAGTRRARAAQKRARGCRRAARARRASCPSSRRRRRAHRRGASRGRPVADVEVAPRPAAALRAEHVRELRRRPREVAAFLAVAVGVARGEEAAARRPHVARRGTSSVVARDLREVGAPGRLGRLEVDDGEQRVVVEHLLEVRHPPRGVDGVAVEPAAELIVDAARRHRVERADDHVERRRVARAAMLAQQEEELRRAAGTSAARRSRRARRRTSRRSPAYAAVERRVARRHRAARRRGGRLQTPDDVRRGGFRSRRVLRVHARRARRSSSRNPTAARARRRAAGSRCPRRTAADRA